MDTSEHPEWSHPLRGGHCKSKSQVIRFLAEKVVIPLGITDFTLVLSHVTLLLLWHLPALQPGSHRAAASMLVKAQGEGSLWDHDSWSRGWEVDQQTAPMQSRTPQTLPCPRNVPSAHLPHSQKPLQECSLSRNWHCLDAISDQTHSRPLYKRFRFWQTGVKNCFSWGCPRQTSWVSSLGIKPASLQPGRSASPSGFKWNLDRSQGSCKLTYIFENQSHLYL